MTGRARGAGSCAAGVIVAIGSLLAGAAPAAAASYGYSFRYASPNGTPITDLLFYAQDAGGTAEFQAVPDILPVSGTASLTQSTSFDAERVMMFGLAERLLPAGEPPKWDIVVLVDPLFLDANLGTRWGELFPESAVNPRHRDVPDVIRDARAGNTAALAAFLATDPAQAMLFDPLGDFAAAQFTPITPIETVPLPPALWLLGGALAGLAGLATGRARRAGAA